LGPVSEDTKLWLCGVVFLLISLVCFYIPWEFISIYEYIKDNEQALRIYNRLRKFYGFIALAIGMFVIGRMILRTFL